MHYLLRLAHSNVYWLKSRAPQTNTGSVAGPCTACAAPAFYLNSGHPICNLKHKGKRLAMCSHVCLLLLLQVSLWYGGEIATWFFGQGPDVSSLVSKYSRWMIPGLWPMVRRHNSC
jgi:hypothetical protein